MNAEICQHLRTKKIYIPEQANDAFNLEKETTTPPPCWCNRTMKPVGIDDRKATPAACSDPKRHCYQRA